MIPVPLDASLLNISEETNTIFDVPQAYAYPWNAPREAISSPYPTYEEMHSRTQMIAALVRAQELLEKQPTLI